MPPSCQRQNGHLKITSKRLFPWKRDSGGARCRDRAPSAPVGSRKRTPHTRHSRGGLGTLCQGHVLSLSHGETRPHPAAEAKTPKKSQKSQKISKILEQSEAQSVAGSAPPGWIWGWEGSPKTHSSGEGTEHKPPKTRLSSRPWFKVDGLCEMKYL